MLTDDHDVLMQPEAPESQERFTLYPSLLLNYEKGGSDPNEQVYFLYDWTGDTYVKACEVIKENSFILREEGQVFQLIDYEAYHEPQVWDQMTRSVTKLRRFRTQEPGARGDALALAVLKA